MSDQLLFSYGTLRRPGVQLARFGRELTGRPDALVGFRLDTVAITDPAVIADSGSAQHPVAVHTGDPSDAVNGTLFTLTAEELAAADAYEVDDYTRVEVALRSGAKAWVYVDATEASLTGTPADIRAWLRGLEVFAGPLADFDPSAAPDHPVPLFVDWLTHAHRAGLPEPHAMTVATVDDQGMPDARVLILKNVDAHGWQFAAHAESPKGRQATANPRAALTFHWGPLGRQVRVRGTVVAASADHGAADFRARSDIARAQALLGRQSEHLATPAERDLALKESLARVEAEPGLVDPGWTLFTVVPHAVEFWQADRGRVHTRLRYERADPGGTWLRHLLWP